MPSLSDFDPFPLRQDEIPQQEKKSDRYLSRWLNIGDSVEDSEDNHELFKGILLTIGGHTDEQEAIGKDKAKRTVQDNPVTPSEIRRRGET